MFVGVANSLLVFLGRGLDGSAFDELEEKAFEFDLFVVREADRKMLTDFIHSSLLPSLLDDDVLLLRGDKCYVHLRESIFDFQKSGVVGGSGWAGEVLVLLEPEILLDPPVGHGGEGLRGIGSGDFGEVLEGLSVVSRKTDCTSVHRECLSGVSYGCVFHIS